MRLRAKSSSYLAGTATKKGACLCWVRLGHKVSVIPSVQTEEPTPKLSLSAGSLSDSADDLRAAHTAVTPPPPPLTEMLYTHELGFHFSEPKPQGNLEAALPAGVGGW